MDARVEVEVSKWCRRNDERNGAHVLTLTHTHTHLWVYFFSLTDTPRFWMNRTLVSKLKGGGKKESFLSLLLQTRTHMLLDIRFLCIYQKHSSQSSSLPPLPSPTVTHTQTQRRTHTLPDSNSADSLRQLLNTHARTESESSLHTQQLSALYPYPPCLHPAPSSPSVICMWTCVCLCLCACVWERKRHVPVTLLR